MPGGAGEGRLAGMICPNPNCGYSGQHKSTARGSTALMLTLILVLPVVMLFFFWPCSIVSGAAGLLYLLLRSGYRRSCPKCGMQISTDA